MKVLITGASSGIGRDMARILAKLNYNLILVARNEDGLTKIKNDLLDIEKSVTGFVEVDDYFSIKDKEELITFKIIEINNMKHVTITTANTPETILSNLSIVDNPDLILWVIQNDSLIKQGFKEVLINAVRNGENIVNTLRELKVNYK